MDPTSSWLLPRSTTIGGWNEEDTMSSKHLWWGPFTSTFCEHWRALSSIPTRFTPTFYRTVVYRYYKGMVYKHSIPWIWFLWYYLTFFQEFFFIFNWTGVFRSYNCVIINSQYLKSDFYENFQHVLWISLYILWNFFNLGFNIKFTVLVRVTPDFSCTKSWQLYKT